MSASAIQYVYVDNGVIVEGPKPLPNGWRNVSGLCYLSDSDLRILGWLPFQVIDGGGEVEDGSTIEIFPDRVVETKQYRAKTPQDLEIEKQKIRQDRNQLLAHSDWTRLDDAPLSTEQRAAWAVYRQQLRDITVQPDFPLNVVWPQQPV